MNRPATPARMAAAAMTLSILAAPVALAGSANAATPADTVIAADTTPAPPAAPAPAPAAAVQRVVGIDANVVNGLTVTGAKGTAVTLTARGEKTRTLTSKGAAPAVFRQLTPGVTYTVAIGGTKVGTGVPVAAVGPAYGLTVSTTGTPDEVLLRWNHTPAKGQGTAVSYDVAATPIGTIGRSTEATRIEGTTTATVTTIALDPTVKYTLSVTPRNSASTGQATAATMTRTLAEMSGASAVPTTPAPAPTPQTTPQPAPAPGPAPAPATKTIYLCAAGYTESAAGLCEKKTPYAYDTMAYTYHWGVLGGHDVADAYAADMARSTGTFCPWGGSFDGNGLCVGATYHHVDDFGDIKDGTPAGYTDNGSAWTKKAALPTGYTDNGTEWVSTTAKVPTVVPA